MANIYDPKVFAYISSYKQQISDVSNILGISREAIAGAIAEEYNSQLGSTLNQLAENYADSFSHTQILNNYNQVLATPKMLIKPNVLDKLNNVVLNDIGNGNIKVFTAIQLLNDYTAAHTNDDPLDIKIYNVNYKKLLQDINDDNHAATAKFAGLMLKEAENFFKGCAPQWGKYDHNYKDALLITYYNLGRENITKEYNKAIHDMGTYSPKPGVDAAGGMHHLENLPAIREALQISTPKLTKFKKPAPEEWGRAITNGGSVFSDVKCALEMKEAGLCD